MHQNVYSRIIILFVNCNLGWKGLTNYKKSDIDTENFGEVTNFARKKIKMKTLMEIIKSKERARTHFMVHPSTRKTPINK